MLEPVAFPEKTDSIFSIQLTAPLINRVWHLLSEDNNHDLLLRIQILGGGCSGFKYDLHLIHLDELAADDILVLAQHEQGGKLACLVAQTALPEQAIKEAAQAFMQQHSHSVRFVVDPFSLMYLENAEIDFVSDLQGSRIVIRNPNASTTCGCGSSFSMDS